MIQIRILGIYIHVMSQESCTLGCTYEGNHEVRRKLTIDWKIEKFITLGNPSSLDCHFALTSFVLAKLVQERGAVLYFHIIWLLQNCFYNMSMAPLIVAFSSNSILSFYHLLLVTSWRWRMIVDDSGGATCMRGGPWPLQNFLKFFNNIGIFYKYLKVIWIYIYIYIGIGSRPKRKHWSTNLVILPKKRKFKVDKQLQ